MVDRKVILCCFIMCSLAQTFCEVVPNDVKALKTVNITINKPPEIPPSGLRRASHNEFHPHHFHHQPTEREIEEGRMVGFTLGVLVISQYLLYIWRTRSFKTYQIATLCGVWVLPVLATLYFHCWGFLCCWLIYTTSTMFFLRLSLQRPLQKTTPTKVYSWFLSMHRMSYVLVVGGYIFALLDVNDISPFYPIIAAAPKSWGLSSPYPPSFIPARLVQQHVVMADNHNDFTEQRGGDLLMIVHHEPWLVVWFRMVTTTCIFYGLYFGVLTRDVAELCSMELNAALGLSKKSDDDNHMSEWSQRNLCSLCGGDLLPSNTCVAQGSSLRHLNHPALAESYSGKVRGATPFDSYGKWTHSLLPNVAGGRGELFTLKCGHRFHETCLRGWTIVGKQNCCPYCTEPVNLSDVIGQSTWQKQSLLWVRLLDAARYLIVWHPIIITVAHFSARVLLGYHPLLDERPSIAHRS